MFFANRARAMREPSSASICWSVREGVILMIDNVGAAWWRKYHDARGNMCIANPSSGFRFTTTESAI
jgi:hypothetical protein